MGLLGTAPPDSTLESASPSPRQGSIWHRFNIDSTLIRHRFRVKSGNRCRITVESMLNRCQIDPWRGEGEADSRVGLGGAVPNKPLTSFNFLRHVMRAIWSVRPKCSHRCVSLTETPLKPVQSLKHMTENSAEQTVMRTKWFKHIAI